MEMHQPQKLYHDPNGGYALRIPQFGLIDKVRRGRIRTACKPFSLPSTSHLYNVVTLSFTALLNATAICIHFLLTWTRLV